MPVSELLSNLMPDDWRAGRFLGRIQTPQGPLPVSVEQGVVRDLSDVSPTVSELVAKGFACGAGKVLGDLEQVLPASADEAGQVLLSPIDLQCVKAAGVTFAVSTLERVIEERARGDLAAAATLRVTLEREMGGDLRSIRPGSPEAASLKAALIGQGLWSQYLEVAIGPDAEIFTKAPVLSTVGWGGDVGVRSDSHWNNPEPEIVLAVDPQGRAVGAALGNDVNLRDFEGRSALLLGKAKDNNASCALGPFIRLFDDEFTLDDVRGARVDLVIEGTDNFRLEGSSDMTQISRDPEELVRQTLSEHHYPDGLVLFLGTLFAPVEDRDEPGHGFTHKPGDIVTIRSPRLGTLVNRVTTSAAAPPWSIGIGAFMRNLAARGLL